jgi:hypothetical protein
MLRRVSSILGIGLLCLWGVALGDSSVSGWITWMVGLAAIFAFLIAVMTPAFPTRRERIQRPLEIAFGLFCLWAIGLFTEGAHWISWWSLGFSISFLLLALAGSSKRKSLRDQVLAELEVQKYFHHHA